MLGIILAAVFGGLLLFLLHLYFEKSRAASLIKNIPGPKPKPIVGNILDIGKGNKEFFQCLIKFWKEYGAIYRIWLGNTLFIFIGNPKYNEVLLNSNTQIDKAMVYKFMMPWIGNGLLTSTGPHWKKHRKIITPTFHFKILEDFLDIFNSTGKILTERLENELNGFEFDIFPYISLSTLDAIIETAMGVKINAQQNGEHEYVKAIRGMAEVIVRRTTNPLLVSDYILKLSETGKLQRDCLNVLHGMTKRVLEEKKKAIKSNNKMRTENTEGKKKRLAFLDMLLESQNQNNGLTDDEIREEVETFIFEGHDTTASGASYTLFNLAIHGDVQERVFEELTDIFGDSDRDANYDDYQKMRYLECVIKESLRLYPSVPLYGRKLNENLNIGDGYTLPKGASVFVMSFMMQRDPKYFPNPENFDPERFLQENKANMNPFQYLPFSAGPRNCIGQKFAMLEMKSIISKIIRKFKLSPSKGGVTEMEESLSLDMVMLPESGLKLGISLRTTT